MECLWRLYRYRQPYGYCYQPHPPVFYIHIPDNNGIPDYYLFDIGFLEKYEKVCESGEEKSVVLPVKTASSPPIAIGVQRRRPSKHSPGLSRSFYRFQFCFIINCIYNCNEFSISCGPLPTSPRRGYDLHTALAFPKGIS